MFKQNRDVKSPLRRKPLRNPGQSIDEEIQNTFYDEIDLYVSYLVLTVGFTFFIWVFVFRAPQLLDAIALTVAALILCGYLAFKIRRTRVKINQLRLGRDGEKAVAEILDELRALGYGVLHDVVGDRFNLDHVVLTPRGIFVVETKTRTKKDANDQVAFDGDVIRVAGYEPDRDPLIQVKSSSKWLKELLRQSTGKSFPIKGVVVFPGWYVKSLPGATKSEVWVLNPKALPAYIANEPVVLRDEDVHLATFHVASAVRAKQP